MICSRSYGSYLEDSMVIPLFYDIKDLISDVDDQTLSYMVPLIHVSLNQKSSLVSLVADQLVRPIMDLLTNTSVHASIAIDACRIYVDIIAHKGGTWMESLQYILQMIDSATMSADAPSSLLSFTPFPRQV
jgi:hypothetical protein